MARTLEDRQGASANERRLWNASAILLACALVACSDFGDDGLDSTVRPKTFAPVDSLTSAQVDAILMRAAEASDTPDVAIAVLDRIGNPLRLYLRGVSVSAGMANPDYSTLASGEQARLDFALAIARAAAYLSHSQAPLTSRTGQFLNSFHFPAVFDAGTYLLAPPFAFPGQTLPVQATIGVRNTAQAPLWQIEASNRGAAFETLATVPATAYNPLAAIPVATRPDGSVPSPGLGLLPGGVPLYDDAQGGFDAGRRLVGAIGVYVTDAGGLPDPDLAEFMAVAGGGPMSIVPLPAGVGVFLVGVLLPAVEPDPSGTGSGFFDVDDQVPAAGVISDGVVDPELYLIGPVASAGVGLSMAEVSTLVDSCSAVSQETHAAIRLPPDSPCKMIIAICDLDGVLLAVYREEDATLFSMEIAITKARNAVFFSNPASRWTSDMLVAGPLAGRHPLTGFRARSDGSGGFLPVLDGAGNLIAANGDVVDIFPRADLESTGVAITARTLGFLTQPFYPPGIDGQDSTGPLYFLALKNRFPDTFNRQGFAPAFASGDPGAPVFDDVQSGIIFFPGSAALYRDGTLIGGIGVSGDGVEQDDFVTSKGIQRAQEALGFMLEAPADMRADRYSFEGAGVPYFKFPQNPGG